MKDLRSIRQFREQGTLRLFLLSVLTVGVYLAHYIKRQTFRINRLVDKEKAISNALVYLIFIVSYGSLLALIGSFFLGKGHPLESLSNWLYLFSTVMLIIWTFKAGARLNAHYEIDSGDIISFDRCWMFAFDVFYFNYNVNMICRYGIGHDSDTLPDTE